VSLRELALFAGAGGGILGGKLLGWRTVCAVENEPYARDVLMARQNDGCLEAFPIWDDVCTFDGRPWQGIVDVVSGGFPCQDISAAGKGEGIEGDRSGLWSEFARIIGEVQPSFVFVENSPALTARGIGTVLGDLAAMGFDAEWGVLGAHHSGAPHKRDRIWIVATDTSGELIRNKPRRRSGTNRQDSTEPGHDGAQEYLADAKLKRLERLGNARQSQERQSRNGGSSSGTLETLSRVRELLVHQASDARTRLRMSTDRAMEPEPVFNWWSTEPNVGRVADGVAARVDRLRCIGNGQVPAVAALAWKTLIERLSASN
jgi:DNA (cytosine-5)-methyltransferase 1